MAPYSSSRAVAARPYLGIYALAIAIIFVPSLFQVATTFWDQDGGSHAPVILAGVAYALLSEREALLRPTSRAEELAGLAALVARCLVYGFGRVQSFLQLEAFAWVFLLLGGLLSFGGTAALRGTWILLIVVALSIPLPGSLVDDLLVPVKLALSRTVVAVLSRFGLPVGSNGVMISVGFVDLKVADACAGLRSLVSLTAIGWLCLQLLPLRSVFAKVLFILLIVPIALLTNAMRIGSLVLIAYYAGSSGVEAVHDYAAYMEVIVSVALLTLAHFLLGAAFDRRHGEPLSR